MTATRTWEISDIDGSNKRRVTLAQYRAEVDAAHARVKPLVDAFMRGDLKAATELQKAARAGAAS